MSQIYKIDINVNFFDPTYNTNNTIVSSGPWDWIAYSFVYSLKHSTNKFNTLNTDLLNNTFIENNKKSKLFNTFIKGQFVYRALCKFAAIYKYKKAKKYDVNTDLCLRPLSELQAYNIIMLLENNVKYIFRLSDLITIINTALSYSPNFFASPLTVKNPYTNLVFSTTNLYNIYFAIKRSNLIMPVLLHQYFMSGFNLVTFLQSSETIIRDIAINSYVDNTYYNILYDEINEMIETYSYIFEIISIHPKFPKKALVTAMKPYLKLHYYYLYSYSETNRIYSRKLLKKKLKLFVKNNPKFGRIIYKFQFEENSNKIIDVLESFVTNNTHNNEDTSDGVVIIDETNIESNYERNYDYNYEQIPEYMNEDSNNEDSNNEDSNNEDSNNEDSNNEDSNNEDSNNEDSNNEDSNNEDSNNEDSNNEDSNNEDSNNEDSNNDIGRETDSLIGRIRDRTHNTNQEISQIGRSGQDLFNINMMNNINYLNSDELLNTNYTTFNFQNEQEEEIIDRIVQQVQSTINRLLTNDPLTNNINIQYEPIPDYNPVDNSSNSPI